MSARRWLAILIAGAGASIASLSTASVPLVGAPVASVSVPAADLSASPDGVVSVLSPRGGIRFLVMTKTYPPAPLLDAPSASAAVETSHPMPASARMDLQLAADAYRRGAAAYRRAVGDLVRRRYDARVALRVEAPDVDGASTYAAPAPLPDYEALESAERLLDASKALERAITKSTCAPDVPKLRSHLADLDDRMALGAESIADRERYAAQALHEREALVDAVETDPKWRACNAGNGDALAVADAVALDAAKSVALAHLALSRRAEGLANLRLARTERRRAEEYWRLLLAHGADDGARYEAQFRIAESLHDVVLLTRRIGEPLDWTAVDGAWNAAVGLRDSLLGVRYLAAGARFAVEVVDALADEQVARYVTRGCVEGVEAIERPEGPLDEPRDACRTDADRESRDSDLRRVFVREIPPLIVRTMKERAAFIAAVPEALDGGKRALRYRMEIADTLYRYGHFAEAEPRYEAVMQAECGKEPAAFDAWYRLALTANYAGRAKRSAELMDSEKKRSCAMTAEQRLQANAISEPVRICEFAGDGLDALKQARAMVDPAQRERRLGEVAAAYEVGLRTAPSRPEASEVALMLASIFEELGARGRAITIYRFVLDRYAADATLIAFRDGEPTHHVKPDPFAFKQRLSHARQALESLARLYLDAFDYASLAAVDDEIAARTLLDEPMRRDAALAATTLHALLGERDAMNASYARLLTLHPSASERHAAEVAIAATRRRAEVSTVRPRAQRAGLPKVRPPYMTVLIDVQW